MVSDIQELREEFLSVQKGFKKYFLEAFLDELKTYNGNNNCFDGDELYSIIMEVVLNQNAPAHLWDYAQKNKHSQHLIKILLYTVQKSMALERMSLEAKIAEIESTVRAVEEGVEWFDMVFNVDQSSGNGVPKNLYHATPTRNAKSIEDSGILSMNRRFVHLREDKKVAIEVGEAHGEEVIVYCIDSEQMIRDGLEIFCEDFGYGPVWLTKHVAPKYLIESESPYNQN